VVGTLSLPLDRHDETCYGGQYVAGRTSCILPGKKKARLRFGEAGLHPFLPRETLVLREVVDCLVPRLDTPVFHAAPVEEVRVSALGQVLLLPDDHDGESGTQFM